MKNLINSCDNTIDPLLLKKQLDDLLSKSIKADDNDLTNKTKKHLNNKSKTSTKLKNVISNAPAYNPTPIHELNKIKKDREQTNEDEMSISVDMEDDNEDFNVNNKRSLDDDKNLSSKKLKNATEESETKLVAKEDSEIKKILQQKTDSIIVSCNRND